MRVLITGAGGQLGTDLAAFCSAAGDEVYGFDRAGLDVASRSAVHSAVTSLQPEAVINCAAWTAVDACEGDPDRALALNGTAVRWLAEASHRIGAHLVQVSTDYVFDGTLDRPYHEWDDTDPQSVYGLTKLIGEQEALVLGASATVVRTSWVCGVNGNNMVKTIMRLAEAHPQLSFVDDQIGHPTFTHDLAPVLRRLALDRLSGVVHATNQSACSWYQFAGAVVAAMGKDPGMVVPIATADLHPARPAPRPANSVLDNAVLRMAGFAPLRDFREPLGETVAALLAASAG
ncbi:MAG TPA: dTDP-4-dehydrorhamnose reductase [Ilumatobacteraceae bacterium]|nr:dTDP-4-dehydrorhamnose reductase [Ilumatobacteraceae bacterium]HRB03939.1 dTDP-4-dehydrorhamnose reductase [Ilumatobacteraceae bacterium]